MKLWIKSLCFAFLMTVLYSMIPFQADCQSVSEDTFRLHILANSDSEEDQRLKLKVRDAVLAYTNGILNACADKIAAEAAVRGQLPQITSVARQTLLANGCDDPVEAELTRMYFSTRRYDSYTLPAGMYDALRITIGKAEGHNWWCVMYPSLCLSAAAERDDRAKEVYSEGEYRVVREEDVQYKFRVVEWFEQLQAWLRPAS